MISLNKIILFTFLISISAIGASPIANIEDVRRSDEVGNFQDVEFAFSGSRGNEERDDYDLGIALVNNSVNSESMFLLEKSERTNEDIVEDESFFLHARFLWKNKERRYNFETYFQSSENPFQSYKRRNLIGFGIRLSEIEYMTLSVSILHEREDSLLGEEKSTNRVNVFANKNIDIKNDSYVSLSAFFQPSINEFSDDYKYSLSASYNIPISENFLIKFKLSESYDSDPPDLAKKSDHTFSTSFIYSF